MSTQAQLAMMDEQGRVPPIQTVYSDLLGVSYPSKKSQIEMTCSNGDDFDLTSKTTMEIPIAVGTGQWVDLSNSYLKLTISNQTGGSNGTTKIGFKTPHDIIERLQWLGTNSEIIEDVQQYNNLSRLLITHQLGEDGWNYNNALSEFQASTLNTAITTADNVVGNINGALKQITGTDAVIGQGSHHMQTNTNLTDLIDTATNNGSITVCFPLISGITSTGKYLPLGMLKNRSLTCRIQLARAIKAFTASADVTPVVKISGVSLVCDVITMAETYNNKFMDMMRTVGDISMHYTTYKSYQDTVDSGVSALNSLIPDSSRSLKSLFTIFTNQAEANNTDALQLVNPALSSYQYTILSETYPMKDVQSVSAVNRNQAFANLHIALGQLGSITSRCTGNGDAYYNSSTAFSSTFAIGVCAESHNKSSNLLESGINLSNSTQPCRLRATVNPAADLNVFNFALSDRLLMIDRDGNLRSSG